MLQRIEDLVENFSLFEDWEERYRYLIDLGRELPPMDEALKTDETLVRGCTSRVWMVIGTDGGRLHFVADSDAHIVRGLVALLMAAYQDIPLGEIESVDIDGLFERIGLSQNLSPNRRNGFFAMVEKIRANR
ncbi:MAG: SufE family protein [Alphaproteobacteria bacterium]|nr:SufE family protein [Alphaproteobacteria bacterium]